MDCFKNHMNGVSMSSNDWSAVMHQICGIILIPFSHHNLHIKVQFITLQGLHFLVAAVADVPAAAVPAGPIEVPDQADYPGRMQD